MMARVTGLGGIFFKSENPERLYAWYEKHLGIARAPDGSGVMFRWSDDGDPEAVTVWSVFKQDSDYFGKSRAPFMLNYRVDDLRALIETLRSEGVEVDAKGIEEYDYGKFAWIYDPDGTRIELWEPSRT